ncbi:hypothetical protein NZ30_10235 [Xanthomonas translucens pv. undulosa]|nr:hypothetical protein FD63_09765 [Xanthomonas translucens pv. undulosa]AVY66682.1 hypothetical protein NZ30_10235 [Xanthomonas translucens pv. undulosa]
MHQGQPSTTVAQQLAETFGGLLRIHRHIAGAAPEHGQLRDDQTGRARQQQRHRLAGLQSLPLQVFGQTSGAVPHLRIAEVEIAIDQRSCLGSALDLGQQALDQGRDWRQRRFGGVEAVQQLIALLLRQPGQLRQARIGVRADGLQQLQQLRDVALHAVAVEQCGGISETPAERVAVMLHGQGEIEFGAVLASAQRCDLQTGQGQRLVLLHRIQTEHHLVDRGMAERARRLHDLDDPLERQVLVVLRAQHRIAHLLQPVAQRGLRRHLEAQRHGVDEQADQGLHLAARAAGDGGADDQIRFAAEPRQQQRPRRQQHAEQRAAMRSGQRQQSLCHRFRQHELDAGAGIVLQRGARMIPRQRQQRRRAA